MIRLVRWIVAGAFLLVLALVGFYLKDAFKPEPEPEPAPASSPQPVATPGPPRTSRSQSDVVSGSIEVVITKEGERKALVKMRNAELLERRGVWSGEDVEVTSTTDQGVVTITGKRGWVDRSHGHYRLDGDVRVERADGAVLMADKGTHQRTEGFDRFEGRVWVHKGPQDLWTEFLEYRPEAGLLHFSNGVCLVREDPENPVAAVGFKGHYERSQEAGGSEKAVLSGGTIITAPDLELRGSSFEVELQDGKPQRAWLRRPKKGAVQVILTRPPGCDDRVAAIHLQTIQLQANFDTEGRVVSVSTPLKRSTLTHLEAWDEEGGPVWILDTTTATAQFDPETSDLKQVQTGGFTRLVRPSEEEGTAPMELEAGSVWALFRPDSGSLERAELKNGVTLKREGAVLTGQSGVWSEEVLTVTGEPVLSEPGVRLEATAIELREGGGVAARGGVIALIESGAGAAVSDQSEADARVQIAAQSMDSEDDGRWVVFRGEAQATRGETVLEAGSIKLNRPEGDLLAEGEARLRTADARGNALSAHADRLLLPGDGDSMELDGSVRLLVEEIVVRADAARLTLKSDGQTAERLVAWGEEVLTDRGQDRVTSERVDYDPETGRAVFTSEAAPALYVDAQGYEYRGFSLTVDRGDDRIFIGPDTTRTRSDEDFARTTIPEARKP